MLGGGGKGVDDAHRLNGEEKERTERRRILVGWFTSILLPTCLLTTRRHVPRVSCRHLKLEGSVGWFLSQLPGGALALSATRKPACLYCGNDTVVNHSTEAEEEDYSFRSRHPLRRSRGEFPQAV